MLPDAPIKPFGINTALHFPGSTWGTGRGRAQKQTFISQVEQGEGNRDGVASKRGGDCRNEPGFIQQDLLDAIS